jgi:hypothetical protein
VSNSSLSGMGLDWFYKIQNYQYQNQLYDLALTESRLKMEILQLSQQLANARQDNPGSVDTQALAVTEARLRTLRRMEVNLKIAKDTIQSQMGIMGEMQQSGNQLLGSIPGAAGGQP